MSVQVLTKEQVKEIFGSDVDLTSKKQRYPWKDLGVGDAFFVPAHEIKRGTIGGYAYEQGKALKRKFSVRTTKQDGQEGFLIIRSQ